MSNWRDIELNGWRDVDLSGDDPFAVDVFGDVDRPSSASASADAAKLIVQQAQSRPDPAAAGVVDIDDDPAAVELFEEPWQDVRDGSAEIFAGLFGDDPAGEPALFASPEYPLLRRIYRKFSSMQPKPRKIRVDTEESYKDFCAGKAKPRVRELAARMADLEQAYAEHVADGHGGAFSDPERLKRIASDVSRLKSEAVQGGEPIPLKLPPWAEGKIRCWQDGDKIYCSVRVCTHDGKGRVLTAADPITDHIDSVAGYMGAAGVDHVDVLGALPVLTQMLGGGSLVPQLAAASSSLLGRDEVMKQSKPLVAKVAPKGDPALSSLMMLRQCAERGNKQAQRETARLALAAKKDKGLSGLLKRGMERLKLARGGKK